MRMGLKSRSTPHHHHLMTPPAPDTDDVMVAHHNRNLRIMLRRRERRLIMWIVFPSLVLACVSSSSSSSSSVSAFTAVVTPSHRHHHCQCTTKPTAATPAIASTSQQQRYSWAWAADSLSRVSPPTRRHAASASGGADEELPSASAASSSQLSTDDDHDGNEEASSGFFDLDEDDYNTIGDDVLYDDEDAQPQTAAAAAAAAAADAAAADDKNYESYYRDKYSQFNDNNILANYYGNEADGGGYTREEADILEEREDRLYVDEFGVRRQIERCVLVGVEDLSLSRRRRRRNRFQQNHKSSNQNTGDDSINDNSSNNDGAFTNELYNLYQPETSSWSSGGTNNSNDDNGADTDNGEPYFTLEESMSEMRELLKTAGMEVVGEITQRLQEVNPKTYIGSGKVAEANDMLQSHDSCTVVFDAELTPGQQKALENAFNKKLLQNDFLVSEREIKVIDRTALILDIFAQHAKTREGKLQVELALHEYRKPRLTRMWTHLERQSGAGGVGLRGPGESQLEIDKRLLRDRIITLQTKINDVQKQRTMHRRGRERLGLPMLSLVGYTNSGKSSVLNYLTRAGVMAQSMLFATVDPTTRKVALPGYTTHPEVLLTDTVGFIQKLPTNLVAAFRATLEEVKEASVLIHVIDVSNESWEKQERAVLSVLKDIGAADKPIVRVLNKIDLLDPEQQEEVQYDAITSSQHTVAVSALHGDGMQDFVAVVEDALVDLLVPIEVIIPYSKGDELNAVHEQGNVEVSDYREEGVFVRALVPVAVANRLQQYNINHEEPQKQKEEDDIDWTAIGRGRHGAE